MTQYATTEDLRVYGGLPRHVLDQLTSAALNAKLLAASEMADGYLRMQFAVPMASPSTDLKIKVAMITAYLVMSELGFNPEVAPDTILIKNYDDSIRWLEQVAAGKIVPANASDQTPSLNEYAPEVSTDSPRGW